MFTEIFIDISLTENTNEFKQHLFSKYKNPKIATFEENSKMKFIIDYNLLNKKIKSEKIIENTKVTDYKDFVNFTITEYEVILDETDIEKFLKYVENNKIAY